MIRIEVCVGSSCHLKGAQQVVKAFQEEIANNMPPGNAQVELAGSFCQGNCTQGVNVRINEQLFSNVTPEKVADIFIKAVLGGISDASHFHS